MAIIFFTFSTRPTKFCALAACTSIVQPCSDRKLMTCSLLIHQASTSVLLGNLDSWFVSLRMMYCDMKIFVTFTRVCSRLIESCVYTCHHRRSCQSCVIWCRLLQPLVQSYMRHSSYPLFRVTRVPIDQRLNC